MKILRYIYEMVKVLVLVMALSFAYAAYDSQRELSRDLAALIQQSRRYTDVAIRQSEAATFKSLYDVTRATGMLARILCQQERSREDCAALLPTDGPFPPAHYPEQPNIGELPP